MQRRFLVLTLLLSALSNPSARAASTPQPVVVRFGNLLWVHASSGLPYLERGSVYVPLREMCELWRAKCSLPGDGRTATLEREGRRAVLNTFQRGSSGGPYLKLTDLAGPLGLRAVWDAQRRMVGVERTRPVPTPLSYEQGNAYGVGLTQDPPAVPVLVQALPTLERQSLRWSLTLETSTPQNLSLFWLNAPDLNRQVTSGYTTDRNAPLEQKYCRSANMVMCDISLPDGLTSLFAVLFPR